MRRAVAIPVLLALLAGPAGAAEPVDAAYAEPAPRHDAMIELAKPFHESGVKRFENVFFISLPFTALYSSLLTTAAGYAIRGKRFRLTTPVVALDLGFAGALSALIATRDAKANARVPAAPPALPIAPASSATTSGVPAAGQAPETPAPSSTPLR